MLANGVHQIVQIEFENCIFSASQRGTLPSDTLIFFSSMVKDLW